jgi:hypothetical protein
LLGGAALVIRLVAVFAVGDWQHGVWSYEHGEIATNLLQGRGFTVTFLGREGPTSQQAPFYPLLLALLYKLAGIGTPAALLSLALLQSLAGTALVLATAALGLARLPQHRSIGWIAGWGAALYPPHIYAVTHVQVAIWVGLWLMLLLYVLLAPRWRGTWSGILLSGLLLGLLLLTEPIMALIAPLVAMVPWRQEFLARTVQIPAATRGRIHRAALARVMVLTVVSTAVVAPWLWRNHRVHGQWVFVKSTFGYAFWQGNNPSSWGTDKIPKSSASQLARAHDGSPADVHRALSEARSETLYIDDVLLKPSGYAMFTGLSEPQRSAVLGRQAWRFVRDNPAHYGRLCLQRLRYLLVFDATNPKAAHWLYRLSTVCWLSLAGLGLLIALWRTGTLKRTGTLWRGGTMGRALLWPMAPMFAVVVVFHALTIVSARFRIPLEPLTFPWAALAVSWLWQWCLTRRTVGQSAAAGDRATPGRPKSAALGRRSRSATLSRS